MRTWRRDGPVGPIAYLFESITGLIRVIALHQPSSGRRSAGLPRPGGRVYTAAPAARTLRR
jgi:hypothetical protein